MEWFVFRGPKECNTTIARTSAIFEGEISNGLDGRATFATGSINIEVDSDLRGKAKASIRPEDILISSGPPVSGEKNAFKGTISRIVDRGSFIYITTDLPPELTCVILRRSLKELRLEVGQQVFVTFEASDVNVF